MFVPALRRQRGRDQAPEDMVVWLRQRVSEVAVAPDVLVVALGNKVDAQLVVCAEEVPRLLAEETLEVVSDDERVVVGRCDLAVRKRALSSARSAADDERKVCPPSRGRAAG